MKSVTVNLSFPLELLKSIDRAARHESRNRSELIREAARTYVRREKAWEKLQKYASKKAAMAGIKTEEDVSRIVSEDRDKT